MKRRCVSLCPVAVLVSLLAVLGLQASDVRADDADSARPIRVLLTYGGHKFEEEPFFAMFDALPGITYTKAEMPKAAELLKPGLQKRYDVVVMYDMVRQITPQQQKNFAALVKQGIGVVSLHHNLGANRDWDEFKNIIGGKYIFEPVDIEGKHYDKATWSHGEDMHVTVADPDHPITRGIKPFDIHDETYKGYYTSPKAHVLLRTDHPKNNSELAWTYTYGKSRVFYLMLGHDSLAWKNPAYPKLLLQGIRWAAGADTPAATAKAQPY